MVEHAYAVHLYHVAFECVVCLLAGSVSLSLHECGEAFDEPVEDAWSFVAELVAELLVGFLAWDDDVEGDDDVAAIEGVVAFALRQLVAGTDDACVVGHFAAVLVFLLDGHSLVRSQALEHGVVDVGIGLFGEVEQLVLDACTTFVVVAEVAQGDFAVVFFTEHLLEDVEECGFSVAAVAHAVEDGFVVELTDKGGSDVLAQELACVLVGQDLLEENLESGTDGVGIVVVG